MKDLLKYMKPYKKYIGAIVTLTFFNALGELFLPSLMSKIVDMGIIKGDIPYIVKTGGFMLLVAAFSGASIIASAYLSSKTAMSFSRDLRKEVFTKVESLSLGEFNEIGTASLITRNINDIAQVQQVAIMSLRMMIRAPLMLVGGIIMAVSKNKKLSLILVGVMPFLVLLILAVGKKGFPLFKEIQERIDGLNLVIREKITGIRVVRAFDKVDYEEKRFDKANRDLTETNLKVTRIMDLMMPLLNIFLNFTIIAIIWFGSKEVDMGRMQVGVLMAFIQYVMLIMFSLIMVSVMFIMIPRAAASANRINEVLSIEPTIIDKEDALDIGSIEDLEFRNVDFFYGESEKKVLEDINFKVRRGETLAIIGGIGSGKSSLINLIPRFFDPSSGEILLNGINIKDISQASLRANMGYVPQKSFLFSGSIRDNLKYGNPKAGDEEINKALEIAQASDFVGDLEGGLDSEVAQAGGNFSGGQKQRLSIARALVRKPDLYIFDDSFSALDFKTDSNLRRALKSELGDSIFIIVAQRVSTIMDADKILVLDDGKIAGIGRHKSLMEESEVYREIVMSQLSKEEI